MLSNGNFSELSHFLTFFMHIKTFTAHSCFHLETPFKVLQITQLLYFLRVPFLSFRIRFDHVSMSSHLLSEFTKLSQCSSGFSTKLKHFTSFLRYHIIQLLKPAITVLLQLFYETESYTLFKLAFKQHFSLTSAFSMNTQKFGIGSSA